MPRRDVQPEHWKPRSRKKKGRAGAGAGALGILEPPPLIPNPPIRGPPRIPNPPIGGPPTRRPRGGVPIPTGNLADAEEQKLQKLRKYKTHCENLTVLYEHKHNNEIIPLVNYIKKIRDHTPEKRIGDLNIPKFIASLKTITVPEFDDIELQKKIDEQNDMMRQSTNKVRNIIKKIKDFGGTVPSDVLVPGPATAPVFVPMGAPPHFPGAGPDVFVPMGAPPHFPGAGPMGVPVEPEKGRMTRAHNAAKRFGNAATKKLRWKKKSPSSMVLPGATLVGAPVEPEKGKMAKAYNVAKRFGNAATRLGTDATKKLGRKKTSPRSMVLPGGFKSRYKNKNNSKKIKK